MSAAPRLVLAVLALVCAAALAGCGKDELEAQVQERVEDFEARVEERVERARAVPAGPGDAPPSATWWPARMEANFGREHQSMAVFSTAE